MKKKITEEQLNALTSAVRKELKENDSEIVSYLKKRGMLLF